MNNKKKNLNILNSNLHLFNNSYESLKNSNSNISYNNTIYKTTISSNNTNKDINKILIKNLNINSDIFEKHSINKNQINISLNNLLKKTESVKTESITENSNSDAKLIKSYTKSFKNKKLKLDNFILNEINSRNAFDKKSNTFKLINKNVLKTQSSSPYKVFKTNLNDNNGKEKKIFSYLDDGFIKKINDFQIPKEDKIFEEFKKYDYFTKRYNKLYKIKNTTINNFGNKEIEDKNTKSVKYFSDLEKKNKEKTQYTKKFFDSTGRFTPSNLDKEIFECLYKIPEEFNSQIKLLKKTKKRKKLKEYQTELLNSVKNVISYYGYDQLKKNFDEIKKMNKSKKSLNIKFIKNLENEEKKIIEDVNKCNKYFLRSARSKGIKKYKFELPNLKFKSVIKKNLKDKKWIQFMMNRNMISGFESTRSNKSKSTNNKNDEIQELKLKLFKK